MHSRQLRGRRWFGRRALRSRGRRGSGSFPLLVTVTMKRHKTRGDGGNSHPRNPALLKPLNRRHQITHPRRKHRLAPHPLPALLIPHPKSSPRQLLHFHDPRLDERGSSQGILFWRRRGRGMGLCGPRSARCACGVLWRCGRVRRARRRLAC